MHIYHNFDVKPEVDMTARRAMAATEVEALANVTEANDEGAGSS